MMETDEIWNSFSSRIDEEQIFDETVNQKSLEHNIYDDLTAQILGRDILDEGQRVAFQNDFDKIYNHTNSNPIICMAMLLAYARNVVISTRDEFLQYAVDRAFQSILSELDPEEHDYFTQNHIGYCLHYCVYLHRESLINPPKQINNDDSITIGKITTLATIRKSHKEQNLLGDPNFARATLVEELANQYKTSHTLAKQEAMSGEVDSYTSLEISSWECSAKKMITQLSKLGCDFSKTDLPEEPTEIQPKESIQKLFIESQQIIAEYSDDQWAFNLLEKLGMQYAQEPSHVDFLSLLVQELNAALLYLNLLPNESLAKAHTKLRKLVDTQRLSLDEQENLSVPWAHQELTQYTLCELKRNIGETKRDSDILRLIASYLIPRLIALNDTKQSKELIETIYGIIKIADIGYDSNDIFTSWQSLNEELFYFNIHQQNPTQTNSSEFYKRSTLHIVFLSSKFQHETTDLGMEKIRALLYELYPQETNEIELATKDKQDFNKIRTEDIKFYRKQTGREDKLLLEITGVDEKRVDITEQLVKEEPSCQDEKNAQGNKACDLACDSFGYTELEEQLINTMVSAKTIAGKISDTLSKRIAFNSLRAKFEAYLSGESDRSLEDLPKLSKGKDGKMSKLFIAVYSFLRDETDDDARISRLRNIAKACDYITQEMFVTEFDAYLSGKSDDSLEGFPNLYNDNPDLFGNVYSALRDKTTDEERISRLHKIANVCGYVTKELLIKKFEAYFSTGDSKLITGLDDTRKNNRELFHEVYQEFRAQMNNNDIRLPKLWKIADAAHYVRFEGPPEPSYMSPGTKCNSNKHKQQKQRNHKNYHKHNSPKIPTESPTRKWSTNPSNTFARRPQSQQGLRLVQLSPEELKRKQKEYDKKRKQWKKQRKAEKNNLFNQYNSDEEPSLSDDDTTNSHPLHTHKQKHNHGKKRHSLLTPPTHEHEDQKEQEATEPQKSSSKSLTGKLKSRLGRSHSLSLPNCSQDGNKTHNIKDKRNRTETDPTSTSNKNKTTSNNIPVSLETTENNQKTLERQSQSQPTLNAPKIQIPNHPSSPTMFTETQTPPNTSAKWNKVSPTHQPAEPSWQTGTTPSKRHTVDSGSFNEMLNSTMPEEKQESPTTWRRSVTPTQNPPTITSDSSSAMFINTEENTASQPSTKTWKNSISPSKQPEQPSWQTGTPTSKRHTAGSPSHAMFKQKTKQTSPATTWDVKPQQRRGTLQLGAARNKP